MSERSSKPQEWLLLWAAIGSAILVPFELSFAQGWSWASTGLLWAVDAYFLWFCLESERSSSHRSRLFHVLVNTPWEVLLMAWDPHLFGLSTVLLIRLLRLGRVAYIIDILGTWERVRWLGFGKIRIAKLAVVVPLLLHVIACSWHLVPVFEPSSDPTWLMREGMEAASVGTHYIRSLYWSFVTLTTVGYGDIVPGTNLEYVFTMVVMVLGVSMYALTVGMMASLLSNLDSARVQFGNRVDAVNRYLDARDVDSGVREDVNRYYGFMWDKYRGSDVRTVFSDLPEALHLKVVRELATDLIEQVPLLKHASPPLTNQLLLMLELQVYPSGVEVVREGELSDGIYFIQEGEVSVWSEGVRQDIETLKAGEYFGDLSLLLGERRTGTAQTESFCSAFFLSKERFATLRETFPEFKAAMKDASVHKQDKMSRLLLEGVML